VQSKTARLLRFLGVVLGMEGFVRSPVPKSDEPEAPIRCWSLCW
jgi:hypothetical protein